MIGQNWIELNKRKESGILILDCYRLIFKIHFLSKYLKISCFVINLFISYSISPHGIYFYLFCDQFIHIIFYIPARYLFLLIL